MSFQIEFEEIYNDGEYKITANLETGECYCETFIKEDNEWIDISCDSFHTYTKKYVDNILNEYLKNRRKPKQVKHIEKKKEELKEIEKKKEIKLIKDEDEVNNSENIEHIDYTFHPGEDERTYLFRSLLVDLVEYERCKDDNDNNENMYQMMFHLIERAYKDVNVMSDEEIHEFLNVY